MALPPCNQEVFEKGVSLGLFDMPKEEAEAMCMKLTEKTGRLHDWHYIGGRVHIKAMPEAPKPEPKPRPEGVWA